MPGWQRMVLGCLLGLPAWALAAGVLLNTYSEGDLPQAQRIRPPAGLLPFLMQSWDETDRALFDDCLHESPRLSPAAFFQIAQLDLNGDAHPDYFVRPASAPYCSAFYGAHLFRYWLITSHSGPHGPAYQIVLHNGSDEFRVLAASSHHYRDLQVISHNAVEIYTSIWRFDGHAYQPRSCRVRPVSGGRKTMPCPLQ